MKLLQRNKLIQFDNSFYKAFTDYQLIGIDEVGRGALAGPVIACAFLWKDNVDIEMYWNTPLQNLNDSKQLDKVERKKIYDLLIKLGCFGIGYGSVLEIEKLNILNATFLAMKRAFDELIKKINPPDKEPYLLIDGNKFNPYINCRQVPIIGGDAKSSLIASASIIAKVHRDALMHKISKSKKFNRFGWRTNVGYGTRSHRDAIRKHGLTPLHRKLFVRKTLTVAKTRLTTSLQSL